ncbi:pentafunctional arom polypeptide [Ceraceosorus bombacis]|uniref:Pentafunctional arom polypeptide n=1 Tax=Ceraceosorus bombacis TaxID=401625 RepID=A0A0P1BKV6_9BASI|nr:pentafunctional arom polypeptide [Ceraceosorus bombacis]
MAPVANSTVLDVAVESSTEQAGPSTLALAPPAHPTLQEIEASPRRHRLFGYPISHSASPAFQNLLMQRSSLRKGDCSYEGPFPTYSLCETRSIDEKHMRRYVRQDERFGGSAVTMPLKVAVAAQLGKEHILDELDAIAQATGTVNTIVVYPSQSGSTRLEDRRMVGTNTDYLGIRHAILRNVATQHGLDPSFYMRASATYQFPLDGRREGLKHSALIIGSGGTCRSAVWAAHRLGLSPLYLLNRDAPETADVVQYFDQRGMNLDLRPLRSEQAWQEEALRRETGETGQLACTIGAIPSMAPQTIDEKMVYNLAHMFFESEYRPDFGAHANIQPDVEASSTIQRFPLPSARPFLEMCYKPRVTPLLAYAASQPSASAWSPICGVEAMIEQGLAQARMWATSASILRGEAPLQDPLGCATAAGDAGPLGLEAEEEARAMATAMGDVVVAPPNHVAASMKIPRTSASPLTTGLDTPQSFVAAVR